MIIPPCIRQHHQIMMIYVGMYPDHHPKQLVQLFGVLKLGSPNGCVKIPMYTMFGKGIIMMILFGIPKNIIVFQNTLLTILQNGGRKNGNKEKLSIKMYFRMIN